MFYTTPKLLSRIKHSLNSVEPFSMARYGDAELKLFDMHLTQKLKLRKLSQQGLTKDNIEEATKWCVENANSACCVSDFDIYGSETFWPRGGSLPTDSETVRVMKIWRTLYKEVGITNTNFCNPEAGFLLCLKRKDNLISLIKGKNVCAITCYPKKISRVLKPICKLCTIEIPGLHRGHYKVFHKRLETIAGLVPQIDIFLVGGGTLGKAYSHQVFKGGKVAVDLGQVFDCWANYKIPDRLHKMIRRHNKLEFELRTPMERYQRLL